MAAQDQEELVGSSYYTNVLYYYLFMKCKYVSAGAFDLYSKVDSLNFAFVVLVSSTKVTNCFHLWQ